MAARGIFLLAALLVAATTANIEQRRPHKGGNHGHNHGHDHSHEHEDDHPAVVPESPEDLSNPDILPFLDNEFEVSETEVQLENADGSGDDQIIVDRMLHRQQRQADDVQDNSEEESTDVEPSEENNKGSEESEDNFKSEENTENEDQNTDLDSNGDIVEGIDGESSKQGVLWVTCEFGTNPILSCYDCYSRLRCTIVGGKVLPCYSPMKPYCNNGICSAVPSSTCDLTTGPRK